MCKLTLTNDQTSLEGEMYPSNSFDSKLKHLNKSTLSSPMVTSNPQPPKRDAFFTLIKYCHHPHQWYHQITKPPKRDAFFALTRRHHISKVECRYMGYPASCVQFFIWHAYKEWVNNHIWPYQKMQIKSSLSSLLTHLPIHAEYWTKVQQCE